MVKCGGRQCVWVERAVSSQSQEICKLGHLHTNMPFYVIVRLVLGLILY